MPSRVAVEVVGALVAGLPVLGVVAFGGSGAARAFTIYLALVGVLIAGLAIRHSYPTLRLMAAAAGAGLTLGTAMVGVFTFGAALLPALLLWVLATTELYRKGGDRPAAGTEGHGTSLSAAWVGLIATRRTEALVLGGRRWRVYRRNPLSGKVQSALTLGARARAHRGSGARLVRPPSHEPRMPKERA